MNRLLMALLGLMLFVVPTTSAFAETVTNTKGGLEFSVQTGNVQLVCDTDSSYEMVSRDGKITIPMVALCGPSGDTKKTWVYIEIEKSPTPDFAVFSALNMEAFAYGDGTAWPFSVYEESSEALKSQDGREVQVRYLTLKIVVDSQKGTYVLRHHAMAEVKSIPNLRISFGNNTFSTHHGNPYGTNGEVKEDVRNFIRGITFKTTTATLP